MKGERASGAATLSAMVGGADAPVGLSVEFARLESITPRGTLKTPHCGTAGRVEGAKTDGNGTPVWTLCEELAFVMFQKS